MSQPPSPPPPSDPEPPPALDPVVVASDDDLAEAVDEFVRRDPEAGARLDEIGVLQEALRQAVEPSVWQLLLHVDEETTARWADLSRALVRYAFEAGRRFALPVEEDSK